jgi:hypothetical protein
MKTLHLYSHALFNMIFYLEDLIKNKFLLDKKIKNIHKIFYYKNLDQI